MSQPATYDGRDGSIEISKEEEDALIYGKVSYIVREVIEYRVEADSEEDAIEAVIANEQRNEWCIAVRDREAWKDDGTGA